MELTRRAFLRRGALAAAPLLLRQGATSGRKVVVIGAGMAGLATADRLGAAGYDVTVLEARSRPGGRVFTLRHPFADGLYAEAGAMQVFDSHQRVFAYINRLGLETDPILASKLAGVLHVLGRRIETPPGATITWPFEMHADERALNLGGLLAKYQTPHVKEVLEAEARGTFPSPVERYDRLTLTELFREQGASGPAIALINSGLPAGLGDGGDAVSALNLLREAAHRSLRKQSFTIRGGTDRLPRALAAHLGDRVRYGAAVTRIEQTADAVRVSFRHGAALGQLTADRVVCAIPFTVLRRLDIAPRFSRDKQRAVDELLYTSVVRTFVQTRTRFWVGAGLSGNASTDLGVMGVYERTINQAGTRGIIESYAAGAEARRLTGLGEAARLAATIEGMKNVFPQIDDESEGGASIAWDAEEWTRGAYAWFRPGQMTTLLPHIATPEGRVHFAGEHASSQPGWMEGALESADRVVQEIMR